jgi:hypothetical protein
MIHNALLETIENQMNCEDLPEVRETFERLRSLGYSESDSKKFLANALSVEIFEMMKHKTAYDQERYIQRLNGLPESAYSSD